MSIEGLNWALNHAPVTNTASRFVLVSLANHCHPDGTSAFPSVKTIMRYTGLSEQAVHKHLRLLEAAGVIKRSDQRVVVAHISRADRRPIGYDLDLTLRADGLIPVESADVNGLIPVAERANPQSERANRCLDEPSLTIQEPLEETMSDASRLCDLLADLIEGNGSRKPKVTASWVLDMDKLMRLDGRTVTQAEAAIRWSQNDPFWRSNIMSPSKLRTRYETMRLQAQRLRDAAEPKGFDGIRQFLLEEA